ncbi:amino acid adenylation domain-containing protein [Streptomyces bacillaris]|uniref:amino acid adenylation domain-containing protein n=1 Tax=Streptomyces bacillaris TaxID=68179 RepID=UPI0034650F95
MAGEAGLADEYGVRERTGEQPFPSSLPLGEACSPMVECGTVERSVHLSGPVAGLLAEQRGYLLAAVALLARKYSDSAGFRVGVCRTAWDGGCRALDIPMPAGLSLARHCEAVEAMLEQLGGPGRATDEDARLVCVVDGAADGVPGADLVFSGEAVPDGFLIHVACHEHVLSAEAAERALGHLEHLLEQMADWPERPIDQLQLPNRAEQALLESFNETRRPYPQGKTIYTLFAEQALAGPDRIAVQYADGAITYRELHEHAIQLAGMLHDRGVRHHSRVAFALDKSPRVLAVILAILRLGAAYVPVDKSAPSNRRDFLLSDSEADLLLTEGTVSADIPVVDLAMPEAVAGSAPLPGTVGSSRDVAYVMYTSGTTGRPKGVLVSQQAVLRLVLGADYVELSDASVILQTGALAFDATTFEFWGALLNGGTVVLVPEATVLSAVDLAATISRYGVNTLFLTTALFHQLVEQNAGALAGCQVLVGGEMLSSRHVADAMDACPDSSFIHVYGPTENTTFSVAHRIDRRYPGRVPIGRPIANSTAYVMDLDGNPQPRGVPGELYVGGDGLSQGYLNRPELTERSFVHGGIGASERLYRTGDVVCWTVDGQLDFLGRSDDQVKIRGFRVELGEIERQLVLQPHVSEAVVLLDRRMGAVSVLRAYFTAAVRLDPAGLREALRQELPEYMVPSSFVQLDAMPLTRNQKVDRGALAAVAPADTGVAEAAGRLPQTERELLVAGIFARVLGVQQVFMDDDFFDLGGHSLLAMRLWSHLRADLGIEVELRHILDAPSVAGLVSSLEQERTGTTTRPRLTGRAS